MGEERQKGRKGVGGGMEREDKVVIGQGDKGEEKRKVLLSRKGGHAPIPCVMAAEKKFLHLIRGNPL